MGQRISHNHKVTSHNRQLLTAAASHYGYTQLCCKDAGGELELSNPNKLFASPSLSLPTADLRVQP